jgi:endoglucanase
MMLVLLVVCAHARAAGSATPQCRDPYSAQRDPANPLLLASAPGSNPLAGANFFVDGPAHGAAAGAIAQLLGFDGSTPLGSVLSSFADSEAWGTFEQALSDLLPTHPSVTGDVQQLEKIAAEPEVERVSSYSEGGTPAGIFSQTEKLFCDNFLADSTGVPMINTYFLHASLGGCPTTSQIEAYMPMFHARVDALIQAIGDRPVVLLLETDALGSSDCMATHGSLGAWEQALKYEVDQTASLPHAVVYVEAGYSDGNSVQYTARALNAIDISKIRGFYTNDTHINWTINEIRWGDKISALTGGAHFIVNTAQNGNGPLIPANRAKDGNEVLCNPPGRGLGPKPTTDTGFPHVDAFLWTSVPGNSSGTCNGGTPAGTFWAARAIQLASDANARLGPGYPSQPY